MQDCKTITAGCVPSGHLIQITDLGIFVLSRDGARVVHSWSPEEYGRVASDGKRSISFACIDHQGNIVIAIDEEILVFKHSTTAPQPSGSSDSSGNLMYQGSCSLSKSICAISLHWPYVVTASWDEHQVAVLNIAKDGFPITLELEIPLVWYHHVTSLALTPLLISSNVSCDRTEMKAAAVDGGKLEKGSSEASSCLHLIAGLGNGMVLVQASPRHPNSTHSISSTRL